MRLRDFTRPIFEQGATKRLYRGDAQYIKFFSIAMTDPRALFTDGIYLTDSKRIARDYESKGAGGDEGVIFRFGGGTKTTKQDAVEYFIRQTARYMDDAGNPSWTTYRNSGVESDPEWKKRLRMAQAKWEQMAKQVEVRKLVDGDIVIRKKSQKGNLSEFEVPIDWINACLDAERTIPDGVASVLYDALREMDDQATANDLYDYATNEQPYDPEDPYGGGEIPTFRTVYSSITGDSPLISKEGQVLVRRGLKELGYQGIRYLGGLSMGGGLKHNAYVFWNEQAINKMRVK